MVKKIILYGTLALFVMATGIAKTCRVFDYQLTNGLKVIVKEDHRAPVVFSSIWYKVGGSYEHGGITGISHVLEHMMFRGTTRFPAGALEKIINKIGGNQNAFTSDDQTVYHQELPAEALSMSFELEADRMVNLALNPSDFATEIQVVMEERRMRYDDDPMMLTYERFLAAAFVNSPYHHPTIGWMTDLKNIKNISIRNWYQKWYAPNNAIVVVVGDVDHRQVFFLAQKYFAAIPMRSIPKLSPRIEVASLGAKWLDVNLSAKLPGIYMGFQTPSLTTTQERWQPYALNVLAMLLGGGNSSRFSQDLIRKQQIVSTAQAFYDPYQLHSNMLIFFGIPTKGHTVMQVQRAFLKEIKRLQTQLVSLKELNRVKIQALAHNIYDQDSVANQALKLGIPASIGLPWQWGEDYEEHIQSVTPKQIQQIARMFLRSKNLTVAVLNPLKPDNIRKLSSERRGIN